MPKGFRAAPGSLAAAETGKAPTEARDFRSKATRGDGPWGDEKCRLQVLRELT